MPPAGTSADLGGRRGAAREVGTARREPIRIRSARNGRPCAGVKRTIAAALSRSGLPAARPRHSTWRRSGLTGRGRQPPPRAARSSPAQRQGQPTAEGYVLPANPALGQVPVTAHSRYRQDLFAVRADRPRGIEQSGDTDRLERRAPRRACCRDCRERLSPEHHGDRDRRISG